MATWHEITRDPEYQELSEQGKALVKQGFFEREISSDPEFKTFSPQTQKAIFDDFWQTPDDTGQGIVTSTLGSAIRGAGEIVPGTLQGVGALTGITPISDLGESARAGLEYIAPVNPIYEQGNLAKVAQVGGNVASIIGTSGVGGLAGKALGAGRAAAAGSAAARQALTNQAIQAGAKSALYGTGFAQGAAAKAEENKRLGITGAEGYLNLLGGGVSELAPEMLPFGTALESAAARRLLGGVDDAAGRVIPGIRMSAAQEAAEGGSTQVLSNLSTQLTAPTGVEAPGLFEGAGEAALWESVGGAMFGAINKLGRTPPEKQTDEQRAYAAELGAVPVNSSPPITPEESLENFNQGGIPVVSPDGVVTTLPFNREDIRSTELPFNREDIRASELPFTREDIRPTQLPFNREDIRSTELPFSRQNIRGLSQLGQPAISPGLTAAVNTADSIVTTAENTSSDVSQATTATRNIIQGVVNTPQPQVAPAIELPAVTPSPAMEMPEKTSQTITDSNGEIAPEMSVLPPTVQAGAGVGEAIQAPTLDELVAAGLPQDEANRLVSAWASDTEPGTIPSADVIAKRYKRLKESEKDAETIQFEKGVSLADHIENLELTGIPKKDIQKSIVNDTGLDIDDVSQMIDAVRRFRGIPQKAGQNAAGIQIGSNDAWIAWRDAKLAKKQPQPIETAPDAIQEQITDEGLLRQERPEMELQGLGEGNAQPQEVAAEGQIQEEVAPPITPQGTPTLATEGKVMPRGSAIERDLLKPYANISIPDLEALPESDWSRRRDYLEGKMRNNQQEKSQLLKTPKSNWENREYNENARINDVAASLRAAIQDMQSSRPDLENQFRAKSSTQAESGEAPGGSAIERDVTKPEQMTPEEALALPKKANDVTINVQKTRDAAQESLNSWVDSRKDRDAFRKITDKYNVPLSDMYEVAQISKGKWGAGITHQHLILLATSDSKPVSAAAVDTYGIKLPQGYVKQGDLYVFSPQTTTVAAPTETAAFDERLAMSNDLAQAEFDYQKAKEASEKASDLFFSERNKVDTRKNPPWNYSYRGPKINQERLMMLASKASESQSFFMKMSRDLGIIRDNYQKLYQPEAGTNKEAAAEQTRREAADAAMAREVERAEKGQAKLEADQKKRDELGLKTLNSLIEKTRTNVVQGTVKSSDANQAVAILNKSGAIPNVLFTWIGTSKDFLADPANRARYPETWRAVSNNNNAEGWSENGQPIVFTDNVGVSDLDRNLAKIQGTTPEIAAVRRVILHENIHKSMFFLNRKDKMKLFEFLHRLYSPEELDRLAKSYDEYADWRINQDSYFSIIEEAMTRDFDSMAEIPRDGIWAEFMQFLRDIWQKITGKTSEPTLKNYKDVFRLIRNSLKNSEASNADRLKNGGATMMSMSEFISNVTPEQDAAYAKAVADGDMDTAQRMVDEAAKAAGFNVGPVYHSTNADFNEFSRDFLGSGGPQRIGFWFSSSKHQRRGGRFIPAYLNLSNPLEVSRSDPSYPRISDGKAGDRFLAMMRESGFDGITTGSNYAVINPNQIKSAEPVTRDEAGNVIPLSRRFQTASNDIRFSKVEYDSPNEAAFNSGAEVARNSDYDERDKAVRSTIRAAYDLAPKDNGPSVPLDQLFDIAKQSMPDLTEGEFSQILQDLYEDSGALLQAGESPFIVTTPDGQRAGSAIIVSSLPTGAMASTIDPDDDATKKFVKDIQSIESGTLKAAFEGRQFKDFMPIDRTIKPNKSYEQAAIDYVNSFLAEGGTLEQMANSVIAPNFLAGIGIEDDVMARQALVAEVRNRIVNAGRKKKSKVEKKFFERLNQRISAFWQGVGTKGGRNQGQRAYIIGNPRYSWMFLTDEVDKELKQRRDNILNVQFGNDNATSFTQNSYENADMASTVSADEVAKDTINDTEWDLIKEGEQVFEGGDKTLWERAKALVRRFAFYARAEAAEIKSASKASMTDAERNELNAILTMPKEEREKAKAKDLAEFRSIMAKLLGEESPTDTPAEKTKRKKRKEIIETVEKRVKAGEPIEAPDYVPIITENPQRDEIIDDVANSLLQVAKNRGIKPSQKTALADLVASIKSLLKANIKGEDLKADEAPLGQLLARTYLDNLTATEAKLFAQSWNRGRDKVRKMLAETGLEGAALEAELSAIMPATPTIAYNPSAVRKAITRALREATLDANDLLANPQETKAEILKVWDKAAVDAGLSPKNWQEGRKLAEKSIDEFIIERKAAKERSKKIAIAVVEQSKNPASLADFSNSLAQFKIKPDKVRELFDQAKLLAKRRVQIANDKAIRVLFEAENKLAQSAFFNSSTKPDTIVKAFREQISDPMDRKAFKDRLIAMEVTSEMADRLFDKAARTKDNAQWKRAQDMLEGPNALRNIIREINRARPGDQAPLSKQIPWRKLLSQKAKTVEEYRQRIFDAISANEELKSATPEQKARLADLFTEAWESNRKRILDGMQERLIREKEAKGDLSKKGAEALQEQRMRIVEDINLGIFDNDEIAKIMAEKFGIKSEFTDAEREKIESLIEILQDEKLNRVKRNKAAYELLETLSAQTDIPISKLLANFWVSSVLSGMNTVFSIGMSVFSGMGELTTTLYRIFVSAFSNPKQLPSEVAAAFKTLARVLSATPRQANRAWQYLVTGDQAFLDPTMNDALKNMDWDSIGKNTQLAEQMAKSDKTLQKVMGLFMRTVSRLLTALDLFNSGLTKEGSLSLVFRQLNLDPSKIEMLEKKSDLKAYKAQVIRDYFNNVQPKNLNEKALVESYAMAEMMKALDELGSVSENADQMAMQGAMTLDPSGIGGYGYRLVKSMMKSAESGTDKLVERNLRKWDEAQGASDKTEAGVKLALSYIFQFAAYNAANLVGVRFARFAGNKFNQSLSFLPGLGALRLFEAEFDADRIRGKEAFTDMIKRNQLTGVMAAAIGYVVLKAIAEEPDDEKRGAFINGGWSNLTPEKKQQKLASGQKEYTLGFGDTVINYGNWPGSGIIAAIGGLSDLIRFSPEQWSEKTVSDKLMSATASGVFSALEVPALSQFQELFGSSLSSKDPNEQKLTKFARVIGNYAGGFVPRILKDIDYAQDPNLRKYETLWEKIASHIPVYRRYEGKEYYDILGQQIQRNIYPGSREFMTKPTDPAYKVLGALNSRGIWLTPANAEHRMVGKGARRRSLTQEEADNYSLETGKGYKQMLMRYGQRALQMPTERAKAFLLDKADDVRDRALKKVYRGYTPAS